MKYNIYENGSTVNGAVSINGMAPTDFVRLRNDPNIASEASSKQYIDFLASSVKAQQVLSGYFDRNILPGFMGSVESVMGNNILTLSNTGVSPNNYTKVTLGTGGLVTSGGNVTANDIPVLSFSKITTGKPTTLDGYGITDAVNKINGTIDGSLTTNGDPALNEDVATKRYVDVKASTGGLFSVGDLLQGNFANTPDGFLRCNGGEVNKTTYAGLYAVMGFPVSSSGNIGNGAPYKLQYDFNTTQSGDILTGSAEASLPGTLTAGCAFVTKNRVYYCGGTSAVNTVVSSVRTAPINSDGTLGVWSTGTAMPGVLQATAYVITKNRVYLIGGWNNSVTAVNTVYTAPINADGTLGAWAAGATFPVSLSFATAFTTKDRLYVVGGQNSSGTPLSSVYTAVINSDGTIGTWSVATGLPEAMARPAYFVIKNKVYLLKDGTNKLFVSTINTDGTLGAWVVAGNIPYTYSSGQVFQTRNTVYIQLGFEDGIGSTYIIMSQIDFNGNLGAWSKCTGRLPVYQYQANAIVTTSKVYFIGGGTQAAQYSSTIQSLAFSGGLNDYSSFYNGSYTPVSNYDNFRLPDYTSTLETTGKVFVKF